MVFINLSLHAINIVFLTSFINQYLMVQYPLKFSLSFICLINDLLLFISLLIFMLYWHPLKSLGLIFIVFSVIFISDYIKSGRQKIYDVHELKVYFFLLLLEINCHQRNNVTLMTTFFIFQSFEFTYKTNRLYQPYLAWKLLHTNVCFFIEEFIYMYIDSKCLNTRWIKN